VSKAEVQADRAEEEVRESDVELPHPMQPAIDASAALTTNLASSAASTRPDLIVWGESSVGYDLDSHPQILARLTALSHTMRTPLLVDIDATGPDGSIAKVSVLLDAHGIVGQYAKTRLVPFGEYIPLRPLLGCEPSR
jgi:apolipoprotein N-acyltransferase